MTGAGPEMTGRCLCGAVVYAMAAKPHRTTICYCKFCQQATGGPVVILPVLNDADFLLQKGEPKIFTHVSEGSGKKIHIHFCPTCASKLYVRLERFPDMVGLYAGSLNDASLVPMDAENAKQIFVSSARPGTVLIPGLPTYREHAVDTDGNPQTPIMLDRPTRVEDVHFD